MKFLNLTPHPLTILSGLDQTLIPVSGPAPRLEVSRETLGQIVDTSGDHDEAGMPCPVFPIVRSVMGLPVGLPDRSHDTILIVSALVAEHHSLTSRDDLAYPGEAVRDETGKITGAKGLCAGPGLAARLRG